jgi:hypothetical protein
MGDNNNPLMYNNFAKYQSRLACDELSRVEAAPTHSSSICGIPI